jgi:hypothetical protein
LNCRSTIALSEKCDQNQVSSLCFSLPMRPRPVTVPTPRGDHTARGLGCPWEKHDGKRVASFARVFAMIETAEGPNNTLGLNCCTRAPGSSAFPCPGICSMRSRCERATSFSMPRADMTSSPASARTLPKGSAGWLPGGFRRITLANGAVPRRRGAVAEVRKARE